MLLGEFEQRLDEKNRVTVPARLRDEFAGGAMITRYFDGCVSIFPTKDWEEFVQHESARLDDGTQNGRWAERYLFGAASEVRPDRQGRIPVPGILIKHASLDRELVVTGVRNRLEIWNRDAWNAGLAEFGRSAENAAEPVAKEPHR